MCQDEEGGKNLKNSDQKLCFNDAGKLLYEKLNSIFEFDDDIVELGLMLSKQEAPATLEELQSILDKHSNVEPARHVETNIPFLYKDHRIGLSFWCLPLLYRYAYSKLIAQEENQDQEDLLKITRAILLINADCFTAWSRRKEFLMTNKNNHSVIMNELKFLNLVATKHPKSCDSWEHRSWIIRNLIFNDNCNFFSNRDEFLGWFQFKFN